MQKFSRPAAIGWIVEEKGIVFEDNIPLTVYRINYDMTDDLKLNEWATHIRKHYICDSDLTELSNERNMLPSKYLQDLVVPRIDRIPDYRNTNKLGRSVITGEFAEIVLYDLFEYVLGYKALRGRHWDKPTPEAGITGSDVIVAKIHDGYPNNPEDQLLIIESKANHSKNAFHVLKSAKKDSDKDSLRTAFSIDYLRKKYNDKGQIDLKKVIDRFMDKANKPYKDLYIAAGMMSHGDISDNKIPGIRGEDIQIKTADEIFLLHGDDLKSLAYELYKRIKE